MTYTKEQKKEFRKIVRQSSVVMDTVDALVNQDKDHPFSRRALDLDRKPEYPAEIFTELEQMHRQKDDKAKEAIQQAGAAATAHAMRRYCDVLANTKATSEERSQAIISAVQLLFVISKIGNPNTTDMNKKVMEIAAKDAAMTDIIRVARQQSVARKPFHSKDIRRYIYEQSRTR